MSSPSSRTYWCHQCATVAAIARPPPTPSMGGPRCPACGGGFVEELPARALAAPATLPSSPARADLSFADAWDDMRSVLAQRSEHQRAEPGSSRSSSPDIGGSAAIAREAASPPTSPSPSDGGEASTAPTRTGRSPRGLRDASRRVVLDSLDPRDDVLPLGSQHRTSGRRESPSGVFGDYGDDEDGLARFLRDMWEESSFLEVATAQLRARSAPMSDTARGQVAGSDDESSDDAVPPRVGTSNAAPAAAGVVSESGEFSGREGDYFLGDDLSALVDRIATTHPAPHTSFLLLLFPTFALPSPSAPSPPSPRPSLPATSTHTPASRAAVRALPLRIVREEDVAGGVAACAVCHEDMGVGAVTQQLPCRHAYHSDCILPWLAQSNTCPVCRFRLPSQAEADAAPTCPWHHGALLGAETRQGAGGGRGPSGAASSDRWPAPSAASWRASASSARPSPAATHMPLHGAAQGGVGNRGVRQGGMEERGVGGTAMQQGGAALGGASSREVRMRSEAVRRAVGSSWEAYLMRQRARQLGGERLAGVARQQRGEGGRQGSNAREGMWGDAVQGRGEGTGGGRAVGEARPSVRGAGVSERLPAAAAAAASDGLAVWRRDLIGAARGTVFADRGERERRWGGGAVAVRGRVQREGTGGRVSASGSDSGSGSSGTSSDESRELSEASPSSPPLTPSSLAPVLGSSGHGSPGGAQACAVHVGPLCLE
ncbi:unnamed protein product [Closterium sp. Naga37s-1]|nr:unnamed protein product [Closterium sp. Naga37s-1]